MTGLWFSKDQRNSNLLRVEIKENRQEEKKKQKNKYPKQEIQTEKILTRKYWEKKPVQYFELSQAGLLSFDCKNGFHTLNKPMVRYMSYIMPIQTIHITKKNV